tara:strand:+ start:2480 stop:5128 length:2649 start_codon:yes stop_codon:yes gene_type:complete
MTKPGQMMNNDREVARLLWSRFIWRHWSREWKLTAVLLLIIALGVAVFLSIRLANKAAVSGFGLFTESLAGQSDYLIRAKAGHMPLSNARALRQSLGSLSVGLFPVLERVAVLDGERENTIRLVGADLVALQNAGNYTEGGQVIAPESGKSRSNDSPIFLGEQNLVFSGASFARDREIEPGDRITLIVDDQSVEVKLGGVLPENPNFPSVPPNLLIMDLPSLIQLSQTGEVISRIEVRVSPGAQKDEILKAAAERMSEFINARSLILETPSQRKSSVTQMSSAFRLNLTILSGLALLVGTYLIMQAMEAAVIKRRAEIAVLRSLGVTPLQIRRAWIIEGLTLGIAGSALGVVIGIILALGMVGAISRTVNTLYYETTTNAIEIGVAEIGFSMLFGIAASLIAILVPARDAAMAPPAQMMRQGAPGGGLIFLRKPWLGCLFTAAGLAAAFLPPLCLKGGSIVPVGGYVAALLLVLGGSILIGLLFQPLGTMISRLARNAAPMWGYAMSQLRHPGGRHRLTAAGLAVAIGMSAAMGILAASFENTLTSWIGQILRADLYVSGAGAQSVNNENNLSRETWETISEMPGIAGLDKLRRYRVSIQGKETFLGGSDYHDDQERTLKLIWLEAPEIPGEQGLLRDLEGAIPGWFSESFCRRFGVKKGGIVDLPTPAGSHPVLIDGIYAEYGNEAGMIIVHRNYTREWFGDDEASQMAVYLEEGTDAERAKEAIESAFPTLRVRTNTRLREESIRIFHQTFSVTYALEAIAVLIAVTGLGLALAGLLLDRRNELATLKSLGATRREIAIGAMVEGVGIAGVGLIGGITMSFALGWVLIYVINPQSFGWTLIYRVPWLSFIGLTIVTLLAAGIVAYGVGYRNAELRSDQDD